MEATKHQGPNNLIKGSRPPKWSEACNNKADLRLLKKRPLETLSGHRHRPAKSAEAERGEGKRGGGGGGAEEGTRPVSGAQPGLQIAKREEITKREKRVSILTRF